MILLNGGGRRESEAVACVFGRGQLSGCSLGRVRHLSHAVRSAPNLGLFFLTLALLPGGGLTKRVGIRRNSVLFNPSQTLFALFYPKYIDSNAKRVRALFLAHSFLHSFLRKESGDGSQTLSAKKLGEPGPLTVLAGAAGSGRSGHLLRRHMHFRCRH